MFSRPEYQALVFYPFEKCGACESERDHATSGRIPGRWGSEKTDRSTVGTRSATGRDPSPAAKPSVTGAGDAYGGAKRA